MHIFRNHPVNAAGSDAERLDAILAELTRKHRVPAAQLAVHIDGHTMSATASATGQHVASDAKIPVGSITKAFTAALAMLLVSDGDLDLDDPLGEHLPELGSGPGEHTGTLTARQALSHTSGLPASVGDPTVSSRGYLTTCRDLRLVQHPGTGFSYSNIGYVLVGKLIERITGMCWSDAVDTLLLGPLRITPSFVVGSHADDSFLPGHAVGASVVPVQQTITPVQAPAGALALSAEDLVAFGRTQFNTEVAVPAPAGADEFHRMRRPVPGVEPFGLADGWGLGLAVFRDPVGDWVGHDGTADGTSCHLRIDPVRGRIVALTTNANTGATLWEDLLSRLRDGGIPVGDYDTHSLERTVAVPGELSGHYANGDMEYRIDVRDARTAALVVDGEVYPGLQLHRDGAFSVREPASGRRVLGGRILWDADTGRVRALQTGGRVARRNHSVH
jgi:CubicO group peptidase (beta-lactamase class C family)